MCQTSFQQENVPRQADQSQALLPTLMMPVPSTETQEVPGPLWIDVSWSWAQLKMGALR